MIIIDESRLTHDTIAKIGRDCGMEYDYENYTAESYEEFVKSVIERYKFDTEMLSQKIVKILMDGLKVKLSLV